MNCLGFKPCSPTFILGACWRQKLWSWSGSASQPVSVILATAAERYAVLRCFSPRSLAAFRFQSNMPHDPLLAAIDLLKVTDEAGTRALPKLLPSAFLPPRWQRMIFAVSSPDRHLYETAVLASLRECLRGAGVWVAGRHYHRAFQDYLLPTEPASVAVVDLSRRTDPRRYVRAWEDGLISARLWPFPVTR